MGATPKDGPSAGTSLFTALVSSALGKAIAPNLAMTGEITTLGEVISIGGVREKLTACKNHNISRVILPLSNRKHVQKLPIEFKRGFTVFYVSNIRQLYEIAFAEESGEALHANLKDLGVTIDQFEEDNFHKIVFDGENIMDDNKIEHLFWVIFDNQLFQTKNSFKITGFCGIYICTIEIGVHIFMETPKIMTGLIKENWEANATIKKMEKSDKKPFSNFLSY